MKVLVAGDYVPNDRVSALFDKEAYEEVLGDIKKMTNSADFSVVNLECPVIDGSEKPISKVGLNLGCSPSGIKALKWAGFNCVTLANNHFRDYGDKGCLNTIQTLVDNGLSYVGGGVNADEASRILYKSINNSIIAIINSCEQEFSIATNTTAGSNALDPVHQYNAIKEARTKADFVLVITHGGHEHYQLPSLRMIETYRFFIDAGADAVINHHQHCYSGYEIYKGKPLFYGLGNFCFDLKDGRGKKWNYGYLVILDFQKDRIGFQLYPYSQCDREPIVLLLPSDAFDKELEALNSVIKDRDLSQKALDDYYSSHSNAYSIIFEPLSNHLFLSAKSHGILPSLISEKRLLRAKDYITCESHRDILIWWIQSQIKHRNK